MSSVSLARVSAARTSSLAETAPPFVPTAQPPLRERILELLVVGPASLLLFPIAWGLRASLGLDDAELATGFVFFHLAFVLNDPHFAVTYLLFYRRIRARATSPEVPLAQRIRFIVAGALVPAVLVTWGAVALATRSHQAIGWMVQAMYALVGWHYAKQGFGVLVVLSARRGLRFLPRERWALLAHALCAWGFAWAHPARAAGVFEERGVVYWAPPRAAWLETSLGIAFAISAVALLPVVYRLLRDRALVRAAAPFTAFLVTLWLWTVFTKLDPLVRYAIPALHSLQYAYFVWLLRRNRARHEQGPEMFGPPVATALIGLAVAAVVLGALLFHVVPGLLDAWLVPHMHTTEEDLGATPFVAVFYVVVNVHHFFMDHVIWRREHDEAKWLTAASPPAQEPTAAL